MSGRIPLLCPECGMARLVARLPFDYPEAVRVEVSCPECNPGDFEEACYFDRHGHHITRDIEEPTP